ncbi:MAG: SAM-dependent chlorinase/fluorinase, partial [Chloroflexi bacterium]|nr:SAM-dependent chlorinase/fluorinase [Chloroflexota bacterium]
MPRPVIALLSDFGQRDHYVAAMKGVLLDSLADVQIIDISHDVTPGDIVEGAWILAAAWRDLPPGTVVVAVVDPGVGSERRPIGIRIRGRMAVGPDNGLLELVSRDPGDARDALAVELTVRALWRHPISPVFHGRDIFVPIAAALAAGTPLREVGDAIDSIIPLPIARPGRTADGIIGHVIHVDRFGNVVTDIPRDMLPKGAFTVGAGNVLVERVVQYYKQAAEGEVVMLVNSAG